MANIVRQVKLVKSHVILSQYSTIQFPVTRTLCQHPANRENALYERLWCCCCQKITTHKQGQWLYGNYAPNDQNDMVLDHRKTFLHFGDVYYIIVCTLWNGCENFMKNDADFTICVPKKW